MKVYDAFISYSHAKDKPIAAALQSVLQRLGKPWYRRRALHVFRDDTTLSATPELWPSIEQALANSRYFIVIASPQFATSKWCAKEIDYWLGHKSVGTMLIAVTDGDLAWDNAAADFVWNDATPLPAASRRASAPSRDGSICDRIAKHRTRVIRIWWSAAPISPPPSTASRRTISSRWR